jgi:hypothetical protein
MAQKYVENYETILTIVVRKSDTYVQDKGFFGRNNNLNSNLNQI